MRGVRSGDFQGRTPVLKGLRPRIPSLGASLCQEPCAPSGPERLGHAHTYIDTHTPHCPWLELSPLCPSPDPPVPSGGLRGQNEGQEE